MNKVLTTLAAFAVAGSALYLANDAHVDDTFVKQTLTNFNIRPLHHKNAKPKISSGFFSKNVQGLSPEGDTIDYEVSKHFDFAMRDNMPHFFETAEASHVIAVLPANYGRHW